MGSFLLLLLEQMRCQDAASNGKVAAKHEKFLSGQGPLGKKTRLVVVGFEGWGAICGGTFERTANWACVKVM